MPSRSVLLNIYSTTLAIALLVAGSSLLLPSTASAGDGCPDPQKHVDDPGSQTTWGCCPDKGKELEVKQTPCRPRSDYTLAISMAPEEPNKKGKPTCAEFSTDHAPMIHGSNAHCATASYLAQYSKQIIGNNPCNKGGGGTVKEGDDEYPRADSCFKKKMEKKTRCDWENEWADHMASCALTSIPQKGKKYTANLPFLNKRRACVHIPSHRQPGKGIKQSSTLECVESSCGDFPEDSQNRGTLYGERLIASSSHGGVFASLGNTSMTSGAGQGPRILPAPKNIGEVLARQAHKFMGDNENLKTRINNFTGMLKGFAGLNQCESNGFMNTSSCPQAYENYDNPLKNVANMAKFIPENSTFAVMQTPAYQVYNPYDYAPGQEIKMAEKLRSKTPEEALAEQTLNPSLTDSAIAAAGGSDWGIKRIEELTHPEVFNKYFKKVGGGYVQSFFSATEFDGKTSGFNFLPGAKSGISMEDLGAGLIGHSPEFIQQAIKEALGQQSISQQTQQVQKDFAELLAQVRIEDMSDTVKAMVPQDLWGKRLSELPAGLQARIRASYAAMPISSWNEVEQRALNQVIDNSTLTELLNYTKPTSKKRKDDVSLATKTLDNLGVFGTPEDYKNMEGFTESAKQQMSAFATQLAGNSLSANFSGAILGSLTKAGPAAAEIVGKYALKDALEGVLNLDNQLKKNTSLNELHQHDGNAAAVRDNDPGCKYSPLCHKTDLADRPHYSPAAYYPDAPLTRNFQKLWRPKYAEYAEYPDKAVRLSGNRNELDQTWTHILKNRYSLINYHLVFDIAYNRWCRADPKGCCIGCSCPPKACPAFIPCWSNICWTGGGAYYAVYVGPQGRGGMPWHQRGGENSRREDLEATMHDPNASDTMTTNAASRATVQAISELMETDDVLPPLNDRTGNGLLNKDGKFDPKRMAGLRYADGKTGLQKYNEWKRAIEEMMKRLPVINEHIKVTPGDDPPATHAADKKHDAAYNWRDKRTCWKGKGCCPAPHPINFTHCMKNTQKKGCFGPPKLWKWKEIADLKIVYKNECQLELEVRDLLHYANECEPGANIQRYQDLKKADESGAAINTEAGSAWYLSRGNSLPGPCSVMRGPMRTALDETAGPTRPKYDKFKMGVKLAVCVSTERCAAGEGYTLGGNDGTLTAGLEVEFRNPFYKKSSLHLNPHLKLFEAPLHTPIESNTPAQLVNNILAVSGVAKASTGGSGGVSAGCHGGHGGNTQANTGDPACAHGTGPLKGNVEKLAAQCYNKIYSGFACEPRENIINLPRDARTVLTRAAMSSDISVALKDAKHVGVKDKEKTKHITFPVNVGPTCYNSPTDEKPFPARPGNPEPTYLKAEFWDIHDSYPEDGEGSRADHSVVGVFNQCEEGKLCIKTPFLITGKGTMELAADGTAREVTGNKLASLGAAQLGVGGKTCDYMKIKTMARGPFLTNSMTDSIQGIGEAIVQHQRAVKKKECIPKTVTEYWDEVNVCKGMNKVTPNSCYYCGSGVPTGYCLCEEGKCNPKLTNLNDKDCKNAKWAGKCSNKYQ